MGMDAMRRLSIVCGCFLAIAGVADASDNRGALASIEYRAAQPGAPALYAVVVTEDGRVRDLADRCLHASRRARDGCEASVPSDEVKQLFEMVAASLSQPCRTKKLVGVTDQGVEVVAFTPAGGPAGRPSHVVYSINPTEVRACGNVSDALPLLFKAASALRRGGTNPR
jgi:plasmid replication initiation protein